MLLKTKGKAETKMPYRPVLLNQVSENYPAAAVPGAGLGLAPARARGRGQMPITVMNQTFTRRYLEANNVFGLCVSCDCASIRATRSRSWVSCVI
jgi:hypothetical protein